MTGPAILDHDAVVHAKARGRGKPRPYLRPHGRGEPTSRLTLRADGRPSARPYLATVRPIRFGVKIGPSR